MEEECTSCNHHWTTLHNEPELPEPELPDIPLKQHEGYRIIDHGGTIWLTGGFNVDSIAPSKSVYYLTEENRMKWYQAPSTKEARYFHVTAVLNDCLGKWIKTYFNLILLNMPHCNVALMVLQSNLCQNMGLTEYCILHSSLTSAFWSH